MSINPHMLTALSEAWNQIQWFHVATFSILTVAIWMTIGWMKQKQWLGTAEARKANHIWILVGSVAWFWWLPEVQARPSLIVAVLLLFCVLLTSCWLPKWGALAYIQRGYARESDNDSRGRGGSFNVWSTWLLGIYGLALVDGLFRDWHLTCITAVVLGIGDGLAEPVGSRIRSYAFHLPSALGLKKTRRSLAGCLAVFCGSFFVVVIYFASAAPNAGWVLGGAAYVAAVTMLVEAISPNGTDNFFIPLAASSAMVAVI